MVYNNNCVTPRVYSVELQQFIVIGKIDFLSIQLQNFRKIGGKWI